MHCVQDGWFSLANMLSTKQTTAVYPKLRAATKLELLIKSASMCKNFTVCVYIWYVHIAICVRVCAYLVPLWHKPLSQKRGMSKLSEASGIGDPNLGSTESSEVAPVVEINTPRWFFQRQVLRMDTYNSLFRLFQTT